MKKILCAALALSIFLISCGSHQSASGHVSAAPHNSPAKEIVCWGDSMTSGYGASIAVITSGRSKYNISYLSYPEILHALTGMDTYNFGVPGATSEEIAIMQGGIVPDQDLSMYSTIDYSIIEQAKNHTGDILVLEIGSNGGWDDYDELTAQYGAMIAHSDCSEYIIIGDTDDPQNSVDSNVVQQTEDDAESGIGTNDTAWEQALREAFGSHFINMRAFMIDNGLALAGLEPTEADIEAAQYGNISVQLRSDWTHFNSYGYYVQAVGVYQKGQQLGYWD